MEIVEPDFTMKPCSKISNKWDLTFMKRVKKRDTGKFEIEPGDTLYGLTLTDAMKRIAHHRVARKYEEDNITLKQFMKDYLSAYKEVAAICHE